MIGPLAVPVWSSAWLSLLTLRIHTHGVNRLNVAADPAGSTPDMVNPFAGNTRLPQRWNPRPQRKVHFSDGNRHDCDVAASPLTGAMHRGKSVAGGTPEMEMAGTARASERTSGRRWPRRRGRAGLALLLATLLTGCWTTTSEEYRSTVRRPLPSPPIGLAIESVLLEGAGGDLFLDRQVWEQVRPVGSPEQRALWAENGLRAGLLREPLPGPLQELLATPATAVAPRLWTFHQREAATIPTAGPHPQCRANVCVDLAAPPRTLQWQQATAGLWIRPHIQGHGVQLLCEPRIQHGSRQSRIRPTPDDAHFAIAEELPVERFPSLSLEVELQPQDYLVIGGNSEQLGTLGTAMFLLRSPTGWRQRLLLLRAVPPPADPAADLPPVPPPGLRR